MTRSAPRLSPRLRRALAELDNGTMPIAEVWRRTASAAEDLGLPRPSYERVRILVHELRRERARLSTAGVAVDVALRLRPPRALAEHLSGIELPRKPK